MALVISFLAAPITFAVSFPMDKAMISEAQEYGTKNALKSVNEFLLNWCSFEEQAEILDADTAEHAYFYTPFLLVANDARIKILNKKSVEIAAGESIVKSYAGHFTFRAILMGDKKDFAEALKAPVLRQGKNSVKGNVIATHLAEYQEDEKTFYIATIDFHFKNQKFSLEEPVFLSIVLRNKEEKKFYFDLVKLK
jgi:hypothetical protein